jgi:hypothetical protein
MCLVLHITHTYTDTHITYFFVAQSSNPAPPSRLMGSTTDQHMQDFDHLRGNRSCIVMDSIFSVRVE